ncbi:MAG: exodeoxyribonuclease VII small subunit [Elusimicrobiota bacterium]|jgi:exodeoxyribonuclease VII small subunit
MKEKKTETFEKGLDRLEEIVGQLEGGQKELEESLTLFEEGVKLAQGLNKRLDEAKHRVEVLIKEGGKLRAEPLEESHGQ